MRLPALSAAIAARFGCECQLTTRCDGGRCVLRVRYDTKRLPPTWREFIDADDETGRAIAAFIRDATDASGYDGIEVEHAARPVRTVWLPVGTDGVIAAPAAPDYFRRTGQEAIYSPDLHGSCVFKL